MTSNDASTFRVSSRSLEEGQTIPPAQRSDRLGAGGRDESPQLSWSGAPEGTRSYAVTVFDPDAPGAGGYWHWAVVDLPADVTSLPEGAGAEDGPQLPPAALQLKNDAGFHGYVGAAPPPGHGPHRYLMTVHALDVEQSGVDSRTSPASLESRLSDHVLAKATLTGVYERR
jgi:Raf kinase inhibitor-like YbhB/YbcL family protein